ncbi:MAG: diaminopimelate decarboxylase [Eubacteriales bacterium]|nr:diaminopimelate decarboxylase [Eubacteriales bacterium]
MLYDHLSISENGHLRIADYDTAVLAKTFQTPLMVLDEERIRERARLYRQAMSDSFVKGSFPLYASKALSFMRMYEIMEEEGLGIDVVSAGELYTAVRAGFPMEKAFFHGNNKTDEDIALALQYGIGYFVCDSETELLAIEQQMSGARRQKVLLRLTPGIDPHTHEKINTGRIDSKFGAAIDTGQAEALLVQAMNLEHITVCGFHCHIGSQIFDYQPFAQAAGLMLRFMRDMKQKYGYQAEWLNLGGGMAVPYTEVEEAVDYAANIAAIGRLIHDECVRLDVEEPKILMEPGRSVVADAGLTIYTVGTTKEIPGYKSYVSVDGGMTDNPRYALYQSPYTVLPADRMLEARSKVYTVAGRCCESGDLLQEGVSLPPMRRGDLLAVLTTGAYNYAMASHYNRLPKPAVVMLGKHRAYLAVRRESFADLTANDVSGRGGK